MEADELGRRVWSAAVSLVVESNICGKGRRDNRKEGEEEKCLWRNHRVFMLENMTQVMMGGSWDLACTRRNKM